MPRRAVKSKPDQPICRGVSRREGAIPITTALNISALAREHGVSRKTITRRLAKGWRPGAAPTPRTPVAARAQAHPKRPVRSIPIKDHDGPIVRARAATPTHVRPPLGVVRGVLLLLGVAFYVLIALAAVHR